MATVPSSHFTLDLNGTPSPFQLQSATAVKKPYANAAVTVTQLSPGSYRATVPKSGDVRFYRVRHQ